MNEQMNKPHLVHSLYLQIPEQADVVGSPYAPRCFTPHAPRLSILRSPGGLLASAQLQESCLQAPTQSRKQNEVNSAACFFQ